MKEFLHYINNPFLLQHPLDLYIFMNLLALPLYTCIALSWYTMFAPTFWGTDNYTDLVYYGWLISLGIFSFVFVCCPYISWEIIDIPAFHWYGERPATHELALGNKAYW